MSDGDYEVGFKKPPLHTRFKKGVSGNRNGRPRKSKSLQALIGAELERKITVEEGGRTVRLTKSELLAKRVVADAIRGKEPAIKIVLACQPADPTPDFELIEADEIELTRALPAPQPSPSQTHGDSNEG